MFGGGSDLGCEGGVSPPRALVPVPGASLQPWDWLTLILAVIYGLILKCASLRH